MTRKVIKRKNNKVGKPKFKFVTNHFTQAYKYFQLGYTDEQIADKINISVSTYKRNKERFLNYYARQEEKNKGNREVAERNTALNTPTYTALEQFPTDLIRKLILARFSQKDIATCLNISYTTWLKYRKQFPELERIVKTTEMMKIADAVESLHMLGNGFTHPAVHHASYMGEIRSKEYMKYVPPNVQALQTILYNSKLVDFNKEGQQNNLNSKGQILEALEFLSSEDSVSFTEDEAKQEFNEHYNNNDIVEGEYSEVS